MTKLPFQLLIKHTSSKNPPSPRLPTSLSLRRTSRRAGKSDFASATPDKEESLSCTALLRAIPGRREVYDALWNDKSVIVKVFSHKRHLKREWEGLSKLTKLKLNSPEPLFYGKTEDGRFAVVVEKITGSSTVLDAFQTEPNKKLDLLVLVCKELAKYHTKGVLQKDLHLGNFLLADDKVFLLDPGQMRFLKREVAKKTAISQLAMLASYLPDSNTASIEKLCQEYFNARKWTAGNSDGVMLQKQIIAHRKRAAKKGLKKCLRTGKRNLRIKVRSQKPEVKSQKFIGIFDRNFCSAAKPVDFIEQIDELMDKGEILKDGNTCYVSRLTWNNKDIVVKRYNHKGFIHSLRHTIKKSRARQGWLHAHRLGMLQIPTPRPLAYIEHRKAGLIWQSYLVTEYVKGQKLCDFLPDNITEKQRSQVIGQVKELLDKLGKYRITHGDLKHSNILITDNGPVITDLDGMKVHRCKWLYRVHRAADMDSIPAMESE
jgi:tRNA A-37 threonylcarbamoyl transferase component Bud32